MKIEIKPAPRSNPEGLPNLPWNIWKDGVNTNVKPTKEQAEQAAHNVLHGTAAAAAIDIPDKHYLDVFRPRGCPKKGSTIQFYIGDAKLAGEVTDYLSTQFIVQWISKKGPRISILRIDDDWECV